MFVRAAISHRQRPDLHKYAAHAHGCIVELIVDVYCRKPFVAQIWTAIEIDRSYDLHVGCQQV